MEQVGINEGVPLTLSGQIEQSCSISVNYKLLLAALSHDDTSNVIKEQWRTLDYHHSI